MGLGKTVTCVSLIGATLNSSVAFASSPLDSVPPPPSRTYALNADHFAGSVWGMPESSQGSSSSKSAKAKAKEERLQEKLEAVFARHCRIKVKSRATLIICPLSIVSNWEEQFREHWKGEVSVVGGSGGSVCASAAPSGSQTPKESSLSDTRPKRVGGGRPLRIYVYHGNARRPDPAFLANFDAVITTYATLASEFSKQTKSLTPDEDEEDMNSEDVSGIFEEVNDSAMRPPKSKTANGKRKKHPTHNSATEISSALQSVHWFRVVLDEAQYVDICFQQRRHEKSNPVYFRAS
jgi:SWI/SNF-related matrix-associated actin-dependent regulator of chromatin subfamily A3